MTAPDPGRPAADDPRLWHDLVDLAELICWHVGVWHDLGYENPPTPECHRIPPLGERPAAAIKGGHDAVEDIDKMMRQLHSLRGQLVSEMRQDEDIRMARLDAKYGPVRKAVEVAQETRSDERKPGSAYRVHAICPDCGVAPVARAGQVCGECSGPEDCAP